MTFTTASLAILADPACDRTTLRVSGEIDLATAPQLRDEAIHWLVLGTGDLHLDLRDVSFADSSAVETLLICRARAQAAGAELVLRAVPRQVTRLLELTSTSHLFRHAPADDVMAADDATSADDVTSVPWRVSHVNQGTPAT